MTKCGHLVVQATAPRVFLGSSPILGCNLQQEGKTGKMKQAEYICCFYEKRNWSTERGRGTTAHDAGPRFLSYNLHTRGCGEQLTLGAPRQHKPGGLIRIKVFLAQEVRLLAFLEPAVLSSMERPCPEAGKLFDTVVCNLCANPPTRWSTCLCHRKSSPLHRGAL